MAKTLTVTLTGARPVTITKADWPLIASAAGDDCDLRDPALHQQTLDQGQADEWTLCVRQHADGRVLVYGGYTESVLGSGHKGLNEAGELLQPGAGGNVSDRNLIDRINQVGLALGVPRQAIADCIADLPATEIPAEAPEPAEPEPGDDRRDFEFTLRERGGDGLLTVKIAAPAYDSALRHLDTLLADDCVWALA